MSIDKAAQLLKWMIIPAALIMVMALGGCGGGTEGTGTRSYQGNIRSIDQQPLADVKVTIAETGDSSITDELGNFTVLSEPTNNTVTFVLEAEDFSTSVAVTDIPDTSTRLTVNIEVNTETDTAEISNFAVRAGIVGYCNPFFENGEVIRQANRVPDGTQCTVKVRVFGDGALAERIPVAVQTLACDPDAIWETVETGSTGFGIRAGVAQIAFKYYQDSQHCSYRVIAPFNYQHYLPVAYPFLTFSDQEPESQPIKNRKKKNR